MPTKPKTPTSKTTVRELDCALTTEWLETDGRGGYAASTVAGCATRRYHGWLVAPRPGTSVRHVYVSRFEESVCGAEGTRAISMARYGGGEFRPDGHAALAGFRARPWLTATYDVGEATRVQREILMPGDGHSVLCRYSVEGAPVDLELRPLLACREADALTFANADLAPGIERIPDGFRARPYAALPAIHFTFAGAAVSVESDPVWHHGIEFAADLARGYDGHEDQFSPAVVRVRLERKRPLIVAISVDAPLADPTAAWRDAVARRGRAPRGWRARLERSADDFLFRSPAGRLGVLAGFPWFWEWGRDVFLALPGLTLARGRRDLCEDVLSGALPFLREGLLPNIYGTGVDDSHYGSVDASLWFARAVHLYERAGGDRERVLDEYLPALDEIARCYHDGTGLGVAVDDAGMLRVGSPELNPTWMDARTSQGPVTPRDGGPVEVCALWCALLAQLGELHRERGALVEAARWEARAARASAVFGERFWLASDGYLADVWRDGVVDASVRPNMVIAAALEQSPLSTAQRASVVARAERDLLTPVGLRTLAPDDPAYCGRYRGGPDERDGAYHQGTVWPWLLGFFAEAALRAGWPRKRVRRLWDGLRAELDRAGLEHLSEVFDGDAPHAPGGTFAQAWNTGEALRTLALLDAGASR